MYINLFTKRQNIVKKWSRGEMDITHVFGTWIWGSSPYETANQIIIFSEYFEITNSAI